ncbi:flavodoxin family protein [Amycolatopsis alkalitolerans]|uniref:Flavodoxin family protein n=1 Tax=Amycolatopsis alkalitolerans TaxID=2547244 RepID=A0A5C4LRK6_9PSEU|nr:flavodoxin domain-containing protein [Amycolatopsis alkalitolerans]TNC19336.1 flavodoxin family protein [Amycolatopsis alkalitolerans]
MRILVVYESMFGSTEQVARAIADGLAPVTQAEVVNVDDAPADLAGVDLLVVGGPTHVHGMSRASTRQSAADRSKEGVRSRERGMREWLDSLGRAPEGLRAAVFDTRVDKARWVTGSAAAGAAKLLRRKHFELVAEPESFLVTGADVAELVGGELARARDWGGALASTPVAKG